MYFFADNAIFLTISVSVYEAIAMIKVTWELVIPQMITNCCIKVEFPFSENICTIPAIDDELTGLALTLSRAYNESSRLA